MPDQQHPTSKEARETAWHERLRALVHDGPDRNDIPNAANRIFRSIDGNFDRSAGPGGTISEDVYSQ